ncbi:MAG: hypothetical protein ACXVW6_11530 [Nocardioidaceae bacterium]
MNAALAAMLADVGEDPGGRLAGFLGELETLGAGPAPAPGPDLATLLGVPAAGAPTTLAEGAVVRPFRRRVVAGAGALALAVVAATGVAAAANELPSDAQRIVSRLSEHFLPFTFPAPRISLRSPHGDDTGSGPADGSGGAPAFVPPAPVTLTHGPAVRPHHDGAGTAFGRGDGDTSDFQDGATRDDRTSGGSSSDEGSDTSSDSRHDTGGARTKSDSDDGSSSDTGSTDGSGSGSGGDGTGDGGVSSGGDG